MVSDTERWEYSAACNGVDDGNPGTFHTDTLYPYLKKAFCEVCIVSDECLAAALEIEELTGYRYGLWGGTTPSERDRLCWSSSSD